MRSEIRPEAQIYKIQVKLGTQNRMYRWSRRRSSQIIKSSELAILSGFHPGKSNLLIVRYSHREDPVYHEYNGGRSWIPTVPNQYGNPGMHAQVRISILTERKFVESLPPLTMKDVSNLPWLARSVTIRRFAMDHGRLCLDFYQEPAVEGISSFKLEGETTGPLRFHLGDTNLRFQVSDAVGQKRRLSLYHNGYESPSLGIGYGHEFYDVKFVSSDGVRNRLVYKSGVDTFNVATIYLREPSKLYVLGNTRPFQGSFSKHLETLEVDQIRLVRPLERSILWHGGTYDAGRIGSELAYAIGKNRLMLEGLVLPDPNSPGKDLYTSDGRVVIQSRLLTQTSSLNPRSLGGLIEIQISRLIRKLQEDFEFNPRARIGYAILSYLEAAMIRAIIVKVSR